MSELLPYQYAAIGLIFVWSGFVRSGLGFGGAVLSLPFLLMVVNNPIVFLPIVAVHLLLFSAITVVSSYLKTQPVYDAARGEEGETLPSVDWVYLKYALAIMIIPKIIGVFRIAGAKRP